MMPNPPETAVRRHFEQIWGTPTDEFQFSAQNARPGRTPQFELLSVLYWSPDQRFAMSRFATVGMSSRAMLGANYRMELCFRRRQACHPEEQPQFIKFLANLAAYPFVNHTVFDWGHTLKLAQGAPGFPGSQAVLLHSALPGDATDIVPSDVGPVRLFNVIPLTNEEVTLQRQQGTPALVSHFDRQRIDVFSPRPNGV